MNLKHLPLRPAPALAEETRGGGGDGLHEGQGLLCHRPAGLHHWDCSADLLSLLQLHPELIIKKCKASSLIQGVPKKSGISVSSVVMIFFLGFLK